MTDHQPGDDVKGHTDPVRTPVPGRWRITLSRVMPKDLKDHGASGSWSSPSPYPRARCCA